MVGPLTGFPHIWENMKNPGILLHRSRPRNALENWENGKNWEKPLILSTVSH